MYSHQDITKIINDIDNHNGSNESLQTETELLKRKLYEMDKKNKNLEFENFQILKELKDIRTENKFLNNQYDKILLQYSK